MISFNSTHLLKSLVVVDSSIPNHLHRWNARNRFEVGVENGLAGALRLVVSVAVSLSSGVEELFGSDYDLTNE